MDSMDDDGPIAVRDFPEGCVRMPRRAPKNLTRPRPTPQSVSGPGEASDGEGECSHLTLPGDFDRLSPRDQFLQRRELYKMLSEHFQRLKGSGQMVGFRPDLQAMKHMNKNGLGYDYQGLGHVPGVEVGDMFEFRSEMFVVGLHRQVQGGIAWIEKEGEKVACSVVVSGGYGDDIDQGDTVEYTGQGGQVYRGDKRQVEDQKPKLGNKSLVNSQRLGAPVRLIRGRDAEASGWNKIYSYDGLYRVTDSTLTVGLDGHKVYKFQLKRILEQPPLDFKKLRSFKR